VLTARFRADAPPALEELMAQYHARLYAFAYRLTRNHHDAEDVVQETYLRALRAAPSFRGDAALSSWLYIIVRNVAHNRYWYWRRRKGDVTVSLDSPALSADVEAWRNVSLPDERAEFERHELEHRIGAGMEQLSERDRRILQLRTRDHASYEEMARTLGIKIGSVKSRLARARQRLRRLVEAEDDSGAHVLRQAS
jgi:RNA polymerase sigma-70 factor (ECF subfamily)